MALIPSEVSVQAAVAGDGDKKLIEKLRANYDKGMSYSISYSSFLLGLRLAHTVIFPAL